MTQFDRPRALEAALMAAAAASDVLRRRFRPAEGAALETWMKSPGALVTDADLASDHAIAEALEEAGAPGNILSEESRTLRGDDSLTWLIDPLCGTVPFSTGMGHWGINIALRSEGALELAVLSLPPIGEQLAAVRGRGVSRNGQPWTGTPPGVQLSDVAVGLEIDGGLEWARLLKGGLEWVPQVGQVNTFASAAYPMAQVCLGRLAAGVFYGIEPVHLAAGATVAIELGLHVTDGAGQPIDWSGDDEIPLVVVGWPDIHSQLIAAMSGGE